MPRYEQMFVRLHTAGEGAFMPFVMIGDPNLAYSEAVIEALIAAGADALELGVPFSDPVADGPTIARAHIRALAAGVNLKSALALVARLRERHQQLPIGLLVYANVAFCAGIENFYQQCAASGVDSVLLPDVPIREADAFSAAAARSGIDAVYIAPPNADSHTLAAVAHYSRGYIYAVSRAGVTGTEKAASTAGLQQRIVQLQADAGAPVMLGFGISTPQHVRQALAAQAQGAICGSGVVKIVQAHANALLDGDDPQAALSHLQQALIAFVSSLKNATRLPAESNAVCAERRQP